MYADLIETFREKTTEEYFALVARREVIREQWFNLFNDEGLDFVLTVPNPLPAVPHGGMKYGWTGCSYTFLFNIVSSYPRSLNISLIKRLDNCSSTIRQESSQ